MSTRHELKEQLRHDAFRDSVSNVVEYTAAHRQRVITLVAATVVVLAIIGGVVWYMMYERSVRRADLESAFQVLAAPIGPANQFSKTFPTDAAKKQASMKALSEVVAKDGDSREGLTARYYLGTLKVQNGDNAGGEADLKAAAASSYDCAALAKVALAELYAGENRITDARSLLEQLINKPTDLVSKAQAQIILARLDSTTNPQQAQKMLAPLKTSPDPVVAHAADQISSEISK